MRIKDETIKENLDKIKQLTKKQVEFKTQLTTQKIKYENQIKNLKNQASLVQSFTDRNGATDEMLMGVQGGNNQSMKKIQQLISGSTSVESRKHANEDGSAMNKQGKQVVIVDSNVRQPQLASSNPASTAATKTPG